MNNGRTYWTIIFKQTNEAITTELAASATEAIDRYLKFEHMANRATHCTPDMFRAKRLSR